MKGGVNISLGKVELKEGVGRDYGKREDVVVQEEMNDGMCATN